MKTTVAKWLHLELLKTTSAFFFFVQILGGAPLVVSAHDSAAVVIARLNACGQRLFVSLPSSLPIQYNIAYRVVVCSSRFIRWKSTTATIKSCVCVCTKNISAQFYLSLVVFSIPPSHIRKLTNVCPAVERRRIKSITRLFIYLFCDNNNRMEDCVTSGNRAKIRARDRHACLPTIPAVRDIYDTTQPGRNIFGYGAWPCVRACVTYTVGFFIYFIFFFFLLKYFSLSLLGACLFIPRNWI